MTVQAAAGACTGSLQILSGPDFTTCVGGTVATADNVAFTVTPAASLGTELRYKVRVSADAHAADGRALEEYAMTSGFRTQRFATDAKVLYLTFGTGALGGIAGADNACTNRPARPVGVATAKAGPVSFTDARFVLARRARGASVSSAADTRCGHRHWALAFARATAVGLGDHRPAAAEDFELLVLASAGQPLPNTSFSCCVTRTNVVRFESSRRRRAPT